MHESAIAGAATRPTKLLCLPTASGNPYQELMYSELTDSCDVIYAGPGGLRHLRDGGFDILHLHWDDRIFGKAESPEENLRIYAEALDAINQFSASGGQVVWTIHNDTPHKAGDLDIFRRARQQLCGLADVIHTHSNHARDHMLATYDVEPQKIRIIPIPSYLGVYESQDQTLGRQLASKQVRNFLFFGMFRGDKGVHEIRDASAKLTKRNLPFHLRMYGKAFSSQARLLRLLNANPNVDLRTDRVPDEEIPEIFGSSQIYLAPYRHLFSSSSIMLALTFGLPVIGPNTPEMRETVPTACHPLLYDPNSPRGLIRAMRTSIELTDEQLAEYRQSCFEFALERSPQATSQKMTALLSGQKHNW